MPFDLSVELLHQLAITLGVGASTFALTFYILALQDSVIDPSEKRFMKAVFSVLRISMSLIFLTLVVWGVLFLLRGVPADTVYFFKWTMLIIIAVNAFLMTLHKMPMWLGPVLAGGSWYALFFANVWPVSPPPYGAALLYYLAFILVFLSVFSLLKKKYLPRRA
jgi:hypothetical protein